MQNILETSINYLNFILERTNSFYLILIACVCLDYLSGVLNAIVHKKLSSKIGAKGICRKLLIFIIIGLSHMIDKLTIGDGDTLQTAITLFYVANEGISVLENAEEIGLPIPKILEDAIKNMKDNTFPPGK